MSCSVAVEILRSFFSAVALAVCVEHDACWSNYSVADFTEPQRRQKERFLHF